MSEWLPDDHLAHFASDAADALDLSAFHAPMRASVGARHCSIRRCWCKVVVYAYANGVAARVARKLREVVAFRVLAAGKFPVLGTIRERRHGHREALTRLFVQVVKLARESGLLKLGRVGIDGPKHKGHASKRKAMSYVCRQGAEVRLKAEIAALLQQAEAIDQKEDR